MMEKKENGKIEHLSIMADEQYEFVQECNDIDMKCGCGIL